MLDVANQNRSLLEQKSSCMDLCYSEEMHLANSFLIGRNTAIKWVKGTESE